MSKFTTEVRYICETICQEEESTDATEVEEIVHVSAPVIFNRSLECIPEEHREELIEKIIKHYYFREIGYETVGLWKLKMNIKMQEIMPYYVKLYESAKMITHPLEDADFMKKTKGEKSGEKARVDEFNGNDTKSGAVNGNGTYSDTGKTKEKFSDTPQGGINGVDVENNMFISSAKIDDNQGNGNYNNNTNSSSSSTSEFNDNINDTYSDEYGEMVKYRGKMFPGSKSKLLKEYRQTLLNIDMQIVDEFADLFMLLW